MSKLIYTEGAGAVTGVEELNAVICMLQKQNRALLKEIEELRAIAPKRFIGQDGKEHVWHCPDHMIPLIK